MPRHNPTPLAAPFLALALVLSAAPITSCIDWGGARNTFGQDSILDGGEVDAGETQDAGPSLPCGPTTCAGCCAEGVCVTQPSLAACGAAGLECSQCPDGAECVNGACTSCNPQTCPGGCCSGAKCLLPGFESCGTDAGVCLACSSSTADSCNVVRGECRCGGVAACGAGQRCDQGACVCDATSCPTGCCVAKICRTITFPRCGAPGGVCGTACDNRSDRCSAAGECACGDGGTCAMGQRCVMGQCRCDAISCPTGCCEGGAAGTCFALSKEHCGAPGATCDACGAQSSDSCASPGGTCACGATGPCPAGKRCSGEKCICDGASCAGCCQGGISGSCVATPTTSACGSSGGTCDACVSFVANQCLNGKCSCGALGAACPPGKQCVNGTCECNAASCPNGCCQGGKTGTCVGWKVATCGAAGGACFACQGADSCQQGSCGCGGGPACNGLRCCDGVCRAICP